MKVLVVVAVFLTCGTYDELIKSIKNLPSILADDHVDRWFIWIKGDDEDEGKNNDTVAKTSVSDENTNSIKYTIEDIAPSIPTDNSHYVEGRTRYLWIPDGKGQPHLVDLWKAVDEPNLNEWKNIETEYWLYTRKNQVIAQELTQFRADSITNSNFNRSKPITVIVHGWLSDGHDNFSKLIKKTFLSAQDGNVIVVQWSDTANSSYGTAVQAVADVGRHIASFLSWLIDTTGVSWSDVHLVGFSLGAHVAGSAGRFASGRPGRVTGLDPAGPLFHGNPDNLNPNDAQYVEVIHTDGDRLGHFNRLGQADFYVNGGRNPQPDCVLSTCSHSRVVDLFAASVRYNHLIGRRCRSVNEAGTGCSGAEMKMGNAVLSKRGDGIYSVKTSGIWPYLL